ncbi:PAAR domain-containing protein [Pseudomonas trivialis]|uniref:PAAR domain-containing protein n=1 Tax=Pseudomonas trivialis TaxID=200450 RepID=UPI0030CA7700
MPAVVLVGHDHDCPLCGPTTVNSGTRNVTVNGRAVARVGDALGCGAVIISDHALVLTDHVGGLGTIGTHTD